MGVEDSFFDSDTIYKNLLSLLTDFAVNARYYNLDYLTGKKQRDTEPLTRWNNEICTEIIHRHYKPNFNKLARSLELAEVMKQFTLTYHILEDGTQIDDLSDLVMHSSTIPVKQKYSMYYLYTISRFLAKVYIALEYKGKFFPMLSEIFRFFAIDDRQLILRIRRWDRQP